MTDAFTPAIQSLVMGLGVSFGLIVAIGAQNLFVLRQGIRREHVWIVIAVCALSDAVLMSAGVAGLGAAITGVPWLLTVVKWAGAAFLVVYASLAARRAIKGGGSLDASAPGATAPRPRGGALAVLGTSLALTWLNPHVYLDTLVLLGAIGGSLGDQRWWFLLGAVLASVTWFTALGFGARVLGRWLRSERSWRVLDGAIAVIMLAIAVSLVVS